MLKTSFHKTFRPALLGCLAAFAMAGAAQAQSIKVDAPSDAAYRVPVHYYDLNLTSDAGRARLIERINIAARNACGFYMGSALEQLPSSQRCLANARQDALAQADAAINAARGETAVASSR